MTLTGLALRNLTHRPWRTGLTLLGVVLAIASYIALVGLVRGIEGTLLENFSYRGTDIIMTEAGAADVLSSVVQEDVAAEVAAMDGIAMASPELGRMTTVGENTTSFVYGWTKDAFSWSTLDVTAGRVPVPEDAKGDVAGGIMLGSRLAERLALSVGDEIELFAVPMVITGIYTANGLLARNGAVMLLSDMQAQTYRDGQATSVIARFEDRLNEAERDAVIAELTSRYPELAVDPTEEMVAQYMNVRISRIIAWVVSTVAVISAALAVLNTMAMAVNERRGEIAIMGAIGWSRARVIRVLMLEGAWLTVVGSVFGVVVGVIVAWVIAWAPAVEGFVEPIIDASLILRGVALGCGIGLLGAYVPAARAASRDPAVILRGK